MGFSDVHCSSPFPPAIEIIWEDKWEWEIRRSGTITELDP